MACASKNAKLRHTANAIIQQGVKHGVDESDATVVKIVVFGQRATPQVRPAGERRRQLLRYRDFRHQAYLR
jgi:hypothetical protein